MIWPFSRKAPPPPPAPRDCRDWNEDWRIGDTAECVVEFDRWDKTTLPWHRPARGQRLTVTGFREGICKAGYLAYFLEFEGWPTAVTTTAFRKVRPVASEQSEIVERILKAKPGKDRTRRKVKG